MTLTKPQRLLLDKMLIKTMEDTRKRMAESTEVLFADHRLTIEEVASEVDGMYFSLVHRYLKHEHITTFDELAKDDEIDPYMLNAARKFAKTTKLSDADTIACIGQYMEDMAGMTSCTQKDFAAKYAELGGKGK